MASAGKVSAAHLTIDEIAVYYQRCPISEAAQELGVGLTALKRRCREVGILRWPFRQLQSLDMMIKQLSEMDCENAHRAADLARTEKFLLVHDPSRKMPETLRKLRQAQFKEKFTMVRMLLNSQKHVVGGGVDDGDDDASRYESQSGGEQEEEEEDAPGVPRKLSAEEARNARAARAARRDNSKRRRRASSPAREDEGCGFGALPPSAEIIGDQQPPHEELNYYAAAPPLLLPEAAAASSQPFAADERRRGGRSVGEGTLEGG